MGLKNLFASLFGGGGTRSDDDQPDVEPGQTTEYKGYSITPAPIAEGGQFKTAGSISKEIDGQLRQSQFIRADNHATRDQAIEHSVGKARQIIDERASHLLDSERC